MWHEAYNLDVTALPADLNWPDPLSGDAYKQSFLRKITDFFKGRHFENWAVIDESGKLAGLGRIKSEWGISHMLRIRVRSDKRGLIEAALLQHLLQRMQLLPRRRAFMLHDATDEVMSELLTAARFRRERNLEQMRRFLN
jgi:hypothetical protein